MDAITRTVEGRFKMTPYDFIKDATIEEIAEVLYEYYQIGTIEECQEMKRKMEQNR